jgi:orotidine-5'-phosphate decarboxylase
MGGLGGGPFWKRGFGGGAESNTRGRVCSPENRKVARDRGLTRLASGVQNENVSELSSKAIPARERLIFAMDVPTHEEARKLVEVLGDSVRVYKLGLQIFLAGAYYELIDWLTGKGKKVFVDLKFFDVPETVKLAVAQLKNRGVSFATVHGNEAMLQAAVSEKNGINILAVTALTSLDEKDMEDLGFKCSVKELVLSRAKRALSVGCDGVISSGLEVEELRKIHGDKFLIISPGIRPVENRTVDDQKRITTVQDAFRKGADYIVVGRPIRNAPNPREKAEQIQQEIAEFFSRSS